MLNSSKPNWTYKPDKDHTFLLYDPEGDGLMFFKTREERDKRAEEVIRLYLDTTTDEWYEEVEQIFTSEVQEVVKAVDIVQRQGEVDEDGYDEAGEYWVDSDHATKCNYKLQPLSA